MLKTIKRSVLTAARGAGFFDRSAASTWRQSRLLILCYHGIALQDEHQWNNSLYLSPVAFERRMALLVARGYRVLPLGEALERLRRSALPPQSVAITFDDGMSDFCRQAYPILKKYRLPATVYLTTYYCYNQRPIFTVFVNYLLWKGRGRKIEPKPHLGLDRGADLTNAGGRDRAWSEMMRFAAQKNLTAAGKDDLARELASELCIDYDSLASERILHVMRPAEVTEMAAAGVDFELHTHRHRVPRRADLFRSEIEENRKHIQDLTGERAIHFCYPSGEYYPEFFPWLQALGVTSATTCNPGMATRRSALLELPRIVDVTSLSDLEFEGWLSGVSRLLPRRRNPPHRATDTLSGELSDRG